MMIDENLARIRTHRNNIARFRHLLETDLSHQDRSFISRRMAEERVSLEALAASTFPINLGPARTTDVPRYAANTHSPMSTM